MVLIFQPTVRNMSEHEVPSLLREATSSRLGWWSLELHFSKLKMLKLGPATSGPVNPSGFCSATPMGSHLLIFFSREDILQDQLLAVQTLRTLAPEASFLQNLGHILCGPSERCPSHVVTSFLDGLELIPRTTGDRPQVSRLFLEAKYLSTICVKPNERNVAHPSFFGTRYQGELKPSCFQVCVANNTS